MTNQQKGAEAGRHRRALGLGAGGLALACLWLAAAPAHCAPEARSYTAQPARPAALALAAPTGSGTAALPTVLPQAEACPQAAAPAASTTPTASAAPASADAARCPPTLTGRLLGLAARKAGAVLPVPILVF